MTKTQEQSAKTPAAKRQGRAVRPRDAASLLVVDRSDGAARVLMGRRSTRHSFMPDTYVFPGGQCDRVDSRAPISSALHPCVEGQLRRGLPASASPRRAAALAVAALRETFEETGLRVAMTACDGRRNGEAYDLSRLRYLARAITPPDLPRRFDARFFVCFADESGVMLDDVADSAELKDLQWVALAESTALPQPAITRVILAHLRDALANDAALSFERAVPLYRGAVAEPAFLEP